MKIAYLSASWFADIDFSFISNIKKKADLYYFIVITPQALRMTAINIKKQYPVSGIFKANIYPEIEKYSDFIDIEKTFVVNICSNKMDLRYFMIFIKFLFLLIRLKIDILHTTIYSIRTFVLFFLYKKIVLTVHDPIPHSSNHTKRDFVYRKLFFNFTRNFVIFNKNQKNEFISKYNLKNKNIHIGKIGVYSYLWKYSKDQLLKNTDKYILFFGRITSYKGLDFLLPAMKVVHKTHKKIKLIVAGYCKKYYFDISEYQNCSYIEIVNRFIPDNELVPLIQNALFVVCPYIDATQSGVVMSSFAFNVPVLATNVGGLSEYVEHLKSGYIVPPGNVNELTSGMNYLLDNRELLEEQRKYIGEKYRTGEYSWDKITDDFLAFCSSTLKTT